jgi:hypothetical protein
VQDAPEVWETNPALQLEHVDSPELPFVHFTHGQLEHELEPAEEIALIGQISQMILPLAF